MAFRTLEISNPDKQQVELWLCCAKKCNCKTGGAFLLAAHRVCLKINVSYGRFQSARGTSLRTAPKGVLLQERSCYCGNLA